MYILLYISLYTLVTTKQILNSKFNNTKFIIIRVTLWAFLWTFAKYSVFNFRFNETFYEIHKNSRFNCYYRRRLYYSEPNQTSPNGRALDFARRYPRYQPLALVLLGKFHKTSSPRSRGGREGRGEKRGKTLEESCYRKNSSPLRVPVSREIFERRSAAGRFDVRCV